MEWFPIVIFILVMIAIISIIVVFVIYGLNGGPTAGGICSNQNNCPLGYVCVNVGTGGTGICQAGLGTSCRNSNDCANDLACINNVCARQNITITSSTNPDVSQGSPAQPTIQAPAQLPTNQVANQSRLDPRMFLLKRPGWRNTTTANVTASPPVLPISTQSEPQPQPIRVPQAVASYSHTPLTPEPNAGPFIAPEISIAPETSVPTINVPRVEQQVEYVQQPSRLVIASRRGFNDAITPLTDVITRHASIPSTLIQTQQAQYTQYTQHTQSGRPAPIHSTAEARVESVNDAMVRTVIPRARQIIRTDITSVDDEINSDGTVRDVPFDIRSGESTSDDHYVSTPYEEKDGAYYCRKDVLPDQPGHSPVIDVCSYSNATVFLLEDGNIICEINEPENKRYRVSNNIPLTRITSFTGYLYGIGSDNKLYTLPNAYFPTTNWGWELVFWAPINIKHISSTYDSTHLWIQTATHGFLYNSPQNLISKIEYAQRKRVYGRDVAHYIDIDPIRFTALVQPGGNLIHDVYDGALSYYDEVITIHPSDRNEYRRITVVNWRPYYIRSGR